MKNIFVILLFLISIGVSEQRRNDESIFEMLQDAATEAIETTTRIITLEKPRQFFTELVTGAFKTSKNLFDTATGIITFEKPRQFITDSYESAKNYFNKAAGDSTINQTRKAVTDAYESAKNLVGTTFGDNTNEKTWEPFTEAYERLKNSFDTATSDITIDSTRQSVTYAYESIKNLVETTIGDDIIKKNARSHLKVNKTEALRGSVIGAYRSTFNFFVTTSGRKSNVIIIYVKEFLTGKGNSTQWVRVDRSHGNTPYPHMNINPKVSGIPDPHTPISGFAMKIIGGIAKPIEKMLQVAPITVFGFMIYDIYDTVQQEDSGKQVEVLPTKVLQTCGSFIGASQGAAIGTLLFPGVGTIIGSIIGGTYGPRIIYLGC